MNVIEHIPYERYHKIANQLLKELNLLDIKKLPVDIELIIDKQNIDIIPKKELKKF